MVGVQNSKEQVNNHYDVPRDVGEESNRRTWVFMMMLINAQCFILSIVIPSSCTGWFDHAMRMMGDATRTSM